MPPDLPDEATLIGLSSYNELQALEHRSGRPLIVAIVWRGAHYSEAITTSPEVARAIHRAAEEAA